MPAAPHRSHCLSQISRRGRGFSERITPTLECPRKPRQRLLQRRPRCRGRLDVRGGPQGSGAKDRGESSHHTRHPPKPRRRLIPASACAADSIALLESNLKARERLVGADHPDTRNARDNLANAYSSAGLAAEAVSMYEKGDPQGSGAKDRRTTPRNSPPAKTSPGPPIPPPAKVPRRLCFSSRSSRPRRRTRSRSSRNTRQPQ